MGRSGACCEGALLLTLALGLFAITSWAATECEVTLVMSEDTPNLRIYCSGSEVTFIVGTDLDPYLGDTGSAQFGTLEYNPYSVRYGVIYMEPADDVVFTSITLRNYAYTDEPFAMTLTGCSRCVIKKLVVDNLQLRFSELPDSSAVLKIIDGSITIEQAEVNNTCGVLHAENAQIMLHNGSFTNLFLRGQDKASVSINGGALTVDGCTWSSVSYGDVRTGETAGVVIFGSNAAMVSLQSCTISKISNSSEAVVKITNGANLDVKLDNKIYVPQTGTGVVILADSAGPIHFDGRCIQYDALATSATGVNSAWRRPAVVIGNQQAQVQLSHVGIIIRNQSFSNGEPFTLANAPLISVSVSDSNLTLKNVTFNDTIAGVDRPVVTLQNANASLVGCKFRNLHSFHGQLARPNAVALYAWDNSNVTLDQCVFTNITWSSSDDTLSSLESQVVKVQGPGYLNVTNSSFTIIGGSGTAIRAVQYARVQLQHVTIEGIDLRQRTGELRASVVIRNDSSLHAEDCNWHDLNMGNGESAAVLLAEVNSSVTMVDCTFTDVVSPSSPTVQLQAAGAVTLKSCTWNNVVTPAALMVYRVLGPVTLTNINITGCNTSFARWSALSMVESHLVNITGSHFMNNHALVGGALLAQNSSAFIYDSKFYSNSASERGGAVCATGSKLHFEECTFNWNTADSKYAAGGGIYMSDQSHVRLQSCLLSANTIPSGLGGGGLALQDAAAVIVDTIFKRNAATGSDACGGALLSRSSDVEVIGSTFFANFAQLTGGALHIVERKLLLADSMVMGNSAKKGGGLCVISGSSTNASNLTRIILASIPQKSTYISLIGSANISNLGQLPQSLFLEMPVQLVRTTFAQNTCGETTGIVAAGGGIYSDSQLFIDSCTFVRNTCPAGAALTLSHPDTSGVSGPLVVVSSVFRANRAVHGGGAITLSAAPTEGYAVMLNNTFAGNIASSDGGALEARDGWAMYLVRNNFSSNGGSGTDLAGGAVYARSCQNPPGTDDIGEVSPNLYLLENYFDRNTATMGGSLHFRDCNLTVLGGLLAQNRASYGGAIYAVNTLLNSLTTLEIIGAHLEENSAFQQGGALYLKGQGLTLYRSNFTSNRAGVVGGAVAVYDASPIALLPLNRTSSPFFSNDESVLLQFGAYGSIFTGNTAALSGGAIFTDSSRLLFQTCKFDHNIAGDGSLNDQWSDSGGAIAAARCFQVNTIMDSNFTSNTADGGPGGAMLSSTCFFQFVRCSLNNNTARTSGGAIASADTRNSDSSWRTTATLTLSSCNLRGNTALSSDGGAVLAREVNFTSSNSTFAQNTAVGSGGAVALLSNLESALQGSIFKENVAGQLGGGAYIQNTPLIVVIGSKFANNNASRLGGGLSVVDCSCTLTASSLFDGNRAGGRGGALHLRPRSSASASGDGQCMMQVLSYAMLHVSDQGRTLLGIEQKRAASYNATLIYSGAARARRSGEELIRGGLMLSVPVVRAPSQLLNEVSPVISLGAGSFVQVAPGTTVTAADWGKVQVYGTSELTLLNYYDELYTIMQQTEIVLGSIVNMKLGPGSTITALQPNSTILSPGSVLTLLASGEWQVKFGVPMQQQPPDGNSTVAMSVVLAAKSTVKFSNGEVLQVHQWNRFLLLVIPRLGSLLLDMEQGAIKSLAAFTSITVANGSPQTLHNHDNAIQVSRMITVPSFDQPGTNSNEFGRSVVLAPGSRVMLAAASTVSVPDWADYSILVQANTTRLEHNTLASGIQLDAGATLSMPLGNHMLVLGVSDDLLSKGTVLRVQGSIWALSNNTVLMPTGDLIAMSLVLPAGSVIQLPMSGNSGSASHVTVRYWNRAVLVSGPTGSALYDTNVHDGDGAAAVVTMLPDSTTVTLASSTLLTWHDGNDALLSSAGFNLTIQNGTRHDWVLSNGTVLQLGNSTVSFTIIPALESTIYLANNSTVKINDWYSHVLVACPNGTYLADASSDTVAMLKTGATMRLSKGSILLTHDSHITVNESEQTFVVANGGTVLLNREPLQLQPGERLLLQPAASSHLQYETGTTILADGSDVTSRRYVLWGGIGAGGRHVLYDTQLSISYLLSNGSSIQLSDDSRLFSHNRCTTVLPATSALIVLSNGTWLVNPDLAGSDSGGKAIGVFSVAEKVVAMVAAPAPHTVLQFDKPDRLNVNHSGQLNLWGGRNGTMLYNTDQYFNYLLADGSQLELSESSTITSADGSIPLGAAPAILQLELGNWKLSSGITFTPGDGISNTTDSPLTLHVASVKPLPGELGRTCEVDLTDGQYQEDPFGYDFAAVETLLVNMADADFANPNLAPTVAMAAYGYDNDTTSVSGYNATLFIPGAIPDAWDPVGRAAGSMVTCTATVVPSSGALALDTNALLLRNTFISNIAGARGGALYMDGGQGRVLLDSSQVIKNSVIAGDGGGMALFQDDGQPGMSLQVHVVNSTISDNTAALGSGGGVALTAVEVHQQVTFMNSTLEHNSAAYGGALALSQLVSVQLANSSLLNNFAGTTDDGSAITSVAGSTSVTATANSDSDIITGDGGGIMATSCNELQIGHGTRLLNNTATGRGGGLAASACAVLLVEDSLIENNTALSGGGMYLVNRLPVTSGTTSLTASAGSRGGAALGGSIAVVARSHFVHNEATGKNTTATETFGFGGGVLVKGHVSTLLADSNFESNNARLQGGSIFIESQCDLDPTSRFLLESMVPPTAFAGAQSLYNDTLWSLQWPRPKGCWGTVVYLPHFFNNEAERSGGALFSSHPEALSLVCDKRSISGNVSNSVADSVSVNLSKPDLAGMVLEAMKQASYQLLDNRIVQECYREELQRLLNTSLDSLELSGMQLSTLNISENRARGYGYLIAMVPSKLQIVNARWAGGTTTTAALNSTATPTSVPPPPAMSLLPSPAVGTDPAVAVAIASSPLYPLQSLAAVGSLHRRRHLLQSISVSTGGNSSQSEGLAVSPYLNASTVLEYDNDTQDYRRVVKYHLTTTSNKAMDISMLLLDALDQITSENTTLRQAQVRARVIGSETGCYAELVGSSEAVSRNGSATLTGMRLLARKGVNYSIELRVEDSIFSGTVEPLILNVTVPPCGMGEVPREEGYVCQKCDPRSFSLWQDTAPLVDCAYPDLDNITCMPCPDGAECPGGAVLVPRPGFWHSAANSSFMNECPNQKACRDGDDEAQNQLVACQLWWYSKSRDYDYNAHLDRIRSYNNTSDDFDPAMCALWGLPYDHPMSYSQLQCAEGYSGNLCAVCAPVDGTLYASNADFNCGPCFSRGISIMIAIFGFLANVLTSLFSVALTFMTDYTEHETLAVGDLFKVLVVHMQFFVIVTRLNIQWPGSISLLTSVLSAATGAVSHVYSPSCMLHADASPSEAAWVGQLVALISPLLCTMAVAALWLLARFFVFKFPSTRQPIDIRTVEEYREERARLAVTKRMAGKRGLETEVNNVTPGTSQAGEEFDRDLDLHATVLISPTSSVTTGVMGSRLGAMPSGTRETAHPIPHVGLVIRESEEVNQEENDEHQHAGQRDAPQQTVAGGQDSNSNAQANSGSPASPFGRVLSGSSFGRVPQAPEDLPSCPSIPSLETAMSAPVPRATFALVAPDKYDPASVAVPSSRTTPSRQRSRVSFDNLPTGPFGALRRVRTTPRVQKITKNPIYNAGSTVKSVVAGGSFGSTVRGDVNDSSGGPASLFASLKRSLIQVASSFRRRHTLGDDGGLSFGTSGDVSALGDHTPQTDTDAGHGRGPGGLDGHRIPSLRKNPNWFRRFFTYNEEAADGKARWASLANIHRSMAWWRQELLVVMITCFLLYPAWAQATLQIFACYVLDDGSGPYPENQRARWERGYWILNMNQECYTGEHSQVWVPIGVMGILIICLGIPALNFLITYSHRTALQTVHVVQTYGFLYIRYNHERGMCGWEAVMQLQTLILVVVDVFGRVLVVYQQAVLLLLALMTILWSNMFFRPLKDKLLERMSSMSYVVLAVTVALSLFFVSLSERKDPISTLAEVAIGGLIVALNLGLIIYFGVVMFAHSQEAVNRKMAAARQRVLKATMKMQGGISVMRRGVIVAGRSLHSFSVQSMSALMVKVQPSRRNKSTSQLSPTA